MSFLEYYRTLSAAKPIIETLSGKSGREIPTFPDFQRDLKTDMTWLDMFMFNYSAVWEYWVYVRHHGFPSPLLDWTASPYVAAFFAFDLPPGNAVRVCIYAMVRDSLHTMSNDSHLLLLGPYMRSHSRHFQQQCRYTTCVGMDLTNKDYVFRSHESELLKAVGPEGLLIKITFPIGERLTALRHLERMNINAFSLFGTEDSLIRTIARRELLIRDNTGR